MPSWKTVQSKKQTAGKTKLALFVLALILMLLALAQLVKFSQILFSPWKLSVSNQKNFSWNSNFNINFLVHSKKISLILFSPKNGEINIINIPDEVYLETAHGFGKWQLRSIFDFGQSQKGMGGDKLLKDSLSSFFGLPIDGIVEGDLVNMISKKQLSLLMMSNVKSDLTLFDLIRLQMELSKVRFDKIKQTDLGISDSLEKSTLADGTAVLLADPVRLDQLFTNLADPILSSEHRTIAIFNSTNYPQLAQKAARLIANIGGDVIIVSNGKNKYQKTFISGEKSKTLDRLKQIFGSSDTIDAGSEDLVLSRAQINLFLGEDYYDRL